MNTGKTNNIQIGMHLSYHPVFYQINASLEILYPPFKLNNFNDFRYLVIS